jgi:hypothetical protein
MKKNGLIAVVNQETSYLKKQNFFKYMQKVAKVASQTQAEIILGPELALSSYEGMMLLSDLKNGIEDFSKKFKGRLIIPGTGLCYDEGKKEMYNLAPIIFKDGSVKYVSKDSSHMEDLLAEKKGLEYQRGEVSPRDYLDLQNGKNFAVEICRDHGLGKLRYSGVKNIDFQFILANNLLGVSPEKIVVKEGGIVVLVEGKESELSEAYRKIKNQLIPLEKKNKGEYFLFK